MTDRKEGYWWKRFGSGWEVVEVRAGDPEYYRAGWDQAGGSNDEPGGWGPYLGTEPPRKLPVYDINGPFPGHEDCDLVGMTPKGPPGDSQRG